MRYIAILLAGALIAAPVAAVSVLLTDDEREMCETEGGCSMITHDSLKRLLTQAHEAGKATCKSTI